MFYQHFINLKKTVKKIALCIDLFDLQWHPSLSTNDLHEFLVYSAKVLRITTISIITPSVQWTGKRVTNQRRSRGKETEFAENINIPFSNQFNREYLWTRLLHSTSGSSGVSSVQTPESVYDCVLRQSVVRFSIEAGDWLAGSSGSEWLQVRFVLFAGH